MILEITNDQREYQQSVAAFAAERIAPAAADIDRSGVFPRSLVGEVAARGLLAITLPQPWGGAGRDYVSYALAMEAIARASAVIAVIVSVNTSLVAEPLLQFGTDEQKRKWLPDVASGKVLGAFALSEEQAGSDAANQQTTARADRGGYVLNGKKVWVAGGEAADVAIVFAATSPDGGARAVSAFLVPLSTPGVARVQAVDALGVRGLGCMDLELHDVHVDADARLGGEGEGFRTAMWALDGGRIAIAAQALGVGQAALDEAIQHAKKRETFGQPIAKYEAIQWMVADSATELDAARLLTLKAANARDHRDRPTLEAAMAKLSASEAAHRAADRAMQILASHGYRRGSVVERLFRDVRATEIYQGTSEVQRMVIADLVIG